MSEPTSVTGPARSVVSAASESPPPHPNPLPRLRGRGDLLHAALLALAWTIANAIRLRDDPMVFAFAGLLGVVVMLPLERGYAVAAGTIALGVAILGGPGAATVVAAVAFGLWGGVAILSSLRVDRSAAVVVQVALAIALLTWPIWAADLLLRFDVQPLVGWLTWTGPTFAINRAIDPTDAFTHRPWSYRWMNLGQDVPYALPATIWPCVIVHAAVGVVGLIGRRWTQMDADKSRTP